MGKYDALTEHLLGGSVPKTGFLCVVCVTHQLFVDLTDLCPKIRSLLVPCSHLHPLSLPISNLRLAGEHGFRLRIHPQPCFLNKWVNVHVSFPSSLKFRCVPLYAIFGRVSERKVFMHSHIMCAFVILLLFDFDCDFLHHGRCVLGIILSLKNLRNHDTSAGGSHRRLCVRLHPWFHALQQFG